MALFPANEAPQPIAPHGVNKWSLSSRIFHWISVVLLIATWAMIELNEDATDFTYFDLHKAFGLSVLFWTKDRGRGRKKCRNYLIYLPRIGSKGADFLSTTITMMATTTTCTTTMEIAGRGEK